MLNAKDIKGFNLFAGLDEPELAKIAGFCSRQTYESDTVIFDPRTATSDVYLLEGGNESIQIEISVSRGKPPIVVHTLSKGETFGWAPLCPVQIRTAAARVIARTTVIRMDGNDLVRLCEADNHIGFVVMKNLSGIINTRLEHTTLVIRHRFQTLIKAKG